MDGNFWKCDFSSSMYVLDHLNFNVICDVYTNHLNIVQKVAQKMSSYLLQFELYTVLCARLFFVSSFSTTLWFVIKAIIFNHGIVKYADVDYWFMSRDNENSLVQKEYIDNSNI